MMPDPLNPELIRRYADGDPELTADEVVEVEARMESDPMVRAQVAFERELRVRIRRIIQAAPPAPASVRERVRAVFAASHIAAAGSIGEEEAGETSSDQRIAISATRKADTSAPSGSSPADVAEGGARRSWLASPQRANFFYVAATVALIVGAVLFGIFTPNIDHSRVDDLSIETAIYASSEHDRCSSNPEHLNRKAQWTSMEEVSREFASLLEVQVPIADLSRIGYDFVGAGPCDLPGPHPSGHVTYLRRGEGPRVMASLFVVPDHGQYDAAGMLIPFEWYIEEAETPAHSVLQMSDGRVVYFLVCCDENDQRSLAAAIGEQVSRAVPVIPG